MSEHPLLEMAGVHKAFRYFELTDVHLRLQPGQVMGFVGPNGAGKSTTIRILMGILAADRGEVRVLGQSIRDQQSAAKREVGFVSEDMRLYGQATLAWHMQLVASLCPRWDAAYADRLVRRFLLHPDQPVKALSHGERVKATLLLALARRPRLLLLDEPTTGLDPVARHEVLTELMAMMADEGRGILFSSHNTQDVEQISDHITFIDRGRIVESRDKESFLERWRRLYVDVPPGGSVPPYAGIVETKIAGRVAVVTTDAFSPALVTFYQDAGVTVRDVQRMSLEEIFVATVMSGRKERAA